MQTTTMMKNKIDYIHQNPTKREYVDLAREWRYSSARNYEGELGLIEIYREWWEIASLHSILGDFFAHNHALVGDSVLRLHLRSDGVRALKESY